MDSMELKITPPTMTMITVLVMLIFSLLWPSSWPLWLRLLPALVFTLSGLALTVLAWLPYHRTGTTWRPDAPEEVRNLLTEGVYQYSRNPMYLGLVVILLGWGCWLGSLAAFLPLPFFVYFLTRLQIIPEERALERHFNEGFRRYSARVRRWL
jgi:protein-S-isoprenylcysteine O-methyltransferase Ste14